MNSPSERTSTTGKVFRNVRNWGISIVTLRRYGFQLFRVNDFRYETGRGAFRVNSGEYRLRLVVEVNIKISGDTEPESIIEESAVLKRSRGLEPENSQDPIDGITDLGIIPG